MNKPSDLADPAVASNTAARPHINDLCAQFGYVSGLDALRLAAVTIVIVRHYDLVMQLPGGFGVSVFFFISGFLISRLLLAEEKRYRRGIRLGAFYTRRFIRLLPPLLLMGAVVVPALYAMYPAQFSPVQVALSFSYLGNLSKFGAQLFGWREGLAPIEPLWSLAVEEHFYLLLPFALLIFKSSRSRILLMVGAILLALLLRLGLYIAVDPSLADQINYHFTLTRLDSLALGVLLTLLMEAGVLKSPSGWVSHVLVLVGGLLMVVSMVHWSESYEIALKYTFQGLAIGVFLFGVIFAVNYAWLRRIFEWRPFVHLGRISYEMYLWHLPILFMLLYFFSERLIAIPVALATTVIVSELCFRLTTKRLGKWRQRFGGHPVS